MRKKILSLLLTLCVVLSLSVPALADEGTRETDYFPDLPHSDLSFDDMEFIDVTEAQFLAAVGWVESLLASDASVRDIEDAFHVVTDMMQALEADLTILNIRTSIDVNDTVSEDLYQYMVDVYLECYDPFIFLIQELLVSKAADQIIADDALTQDDIDYYMTYGGMSDEEKAISSEISTLDTRYYQAYNNGDLDAMAEIYLRSVELNNALTELYPEYGSYVEYAYDRIYGRDYDIETAQAFFTAVKTYIAPMVPDVYDLYVLDANENYSAYVRMFQGDYTTDDTLSSIRPYIGRLSGELLEAWDYMIGHDLYDIEYRRDKSDQGFTTRIAGYSAPFFFNSPSGSIFDFTTIIHEFGHYSNYYHHPAGWNEGVCSYDIAEVHSQALELLFSQFYPEFFGSQSKTVEDMVVYNMLVSGVIYGSMIGELEIYAYTTPDVTVEMVNRKYLALAAEYGMDADDYDWLYIHHMTTSPMYYISYATSGIGALYFFADAQENGYDKAVDEYLRLMAEPYYVPFQEQFETVCGINPMDPDCVADIAEGISEALDIRGRLYPGSSPSTPGQSSASAAVGASIAELANIASAVFRSH